MNKTATLILRLFCIIGLLLFACIAFNMVGWYWLSGAALILAIPTGAFCVGVVAWDTVKGDWK